MIEISDGWHAALVEQSEKYDSVIRKVLNEIFS